MPHIEALTKAMHGAQFALSDLIAAHKTATPLESILLIDLISQQAGIEARIKAIIAAQPET